MTRICVLFLLAAPALAGPPAVCWRVEIGKARSLPWQAGDFAQDKTYDPGRAVADTLALLGPEMPVLVRMETLRRAALYLRPRRADREALLRRLMMRVLNAEAAGKPDALAWFDAGYLTGCFEQLDEVSGREAYLWVRKAMALRGGDPEMEFACCLLTLMGNHPHHEKFSKHLKAAGFGKSELLKRNLAVLRDRYPPVLKYFAELKERSGK